MLRERTTEIRTLVTRLHFAIELETLPEGMKILCGGVTHGNGKKYAT